MAKTYYIKSNGSRNIPVTDGVYSTSDGGRLDMDLDFNDGVMIIAFYDSSGNPVTPTAGEITSEMSPEEGQWLGPSSGDSPIAATTVIAGSATYSVPKFSGPAKAGRVTFSGITGAASARVYFWRTSNNGDK